MVVALAAAQLALHVNVGKKIHLDASLAFASAGFAASSGHVEGETSGLVAALARFRQQSVDVTDISEDAGISGRIRAGRASNRRLVNANDLIKIFNASNRLVRAGFLP